MGNLRVQRRFCSEYGEAYAKTGIGMKSGQSFRISGIRMAVIPGVTIQTKITFKRTRGFSHCFVPELSPCPGG